MLESSAFFRDAVIVSLLYSLAGFDEKRLVVAGTINGGDTPRDADPQEDVHRVTPGDIAHARVGVLVLASCHFARERIWNKSESLSF